MNSNLRFEPVFAYSGGILKDICEPSENRIPRITLTSYDIKSYGPKIKNKFLFQFVFFFKMKYRCFFMFIFLTTRAHPFGKLWDEIEEWPGLGFQ